MTPKAIQTALQPYISDYFSVPSDMYLQLEQYLELLLKWNARTNLTAIREPEEIVRRHFGESLFAGQHLGNCGTLLDFGSGAGFPGLPIHLLHPNLRVTLAESQNKKASFLREVVRSLGLNTEVWSGRVETMPPALQFDVVTLRAVDNMEAAVLDASTRAAKRLLLLTTVDGVLPSLQAAASRVVVPIPGSSKQQILYLDQVPRPAF